VTTTTLQLLGTTVALRSEHAAALTDFPTTDAPAMAMAAGGSLIATLADVTRLAVEHSPLLCMHAGVVQGPDGIVAIPGRSGLGKTTLVAALVRGGFGYLSDEALAVDRTTGAVAAFARPLALDHAAWQLICPDLDGQPVPGEEALVPRELLGSLGAEGAPVQHILLVSRRPGPVSIRPERRGAAVEQLLRRSFNHFRDPEGSFRTIVALVRGATVWRVEYESAPQLAGPLAEHLSRRG
jgi:hypothetical protein